MTNIYVEYETETWVDREIDLNDSWDNGDMGGRYWVTGVTLSKGWHDFFETTEDIEAGDVVYVVWVSYTSGSAFGYQGGYGDIVVVTKDEAKARQAEAWAETDGETPYPLDLLPEENRKYLSMPWIGYFEHKDSVGLDTFIVKS